MTTRPQYLADLQRLQRETDMLLANVASFSDDEVGTPTVLPGWTRGHVITHLARGAEAIQRLMDNAITGSDAAMYASADQRNDDIESGATRSAKELTADLRRSSEAFMETARRLVDAPDAAEEISIGNRTFRTHALPNLRCAEVIIHHQDLDSTFELHEADPDSQLDALNSVVWVLQGKDDAPGLTVTTYEGDELVIGDGATTVVGERDAMVDWLARGNGGRVRAKDGAELPELPSW